VTPVVTVTNGTIAVQTLSKIESENTWRLVLDVIPVPGTTMELSAHVAGYGRKLTENWLYQWVTA
jgi:periplasmic glucans biosynthesis protein